MTSLSVVFSISLVIAAGWPDWSQAATYGDDRDRVIEEHRDDPGSSPEPFATLSQASGPAATSKCGVDGNPYNCRPTCESLFLDSDWRLTPKQKLCDLVQNRIFSSSGLAASVFAASTQPIWNRVIGRHNDTSGFPRRFATNFGQNAFKSVGAFAGGAIFREDPRVQPPFLILRKGPRPHGFGPRLLHAIGLNFIAYRCDPPKQAASNLSSAVPGTCTSENDIRKVPALSRIVGSLASGYSIELLTKDRTDVHQLALRGAASAYGATFVNGVFEEFKPELSALIGKVFSTIAGGR